MGLALFLLFLEFDSAGLVGGLQASWIDSDRQLLDSCWAVGPVSGCCRPSYRGLFVFDSFDSGSELLFLDCVGQLLGHFTLLKASRLERNLISSPPLAGSVGLFLADDGGARIFASPPATKLHFYLD